MYVFSRSPKYVCPKCRNKITIEDIEGVFHDELHDFFVSQEKIKSHLESANQNLADKKNRLEAHTRQIEKVHTEMRKHTSFTKPTKSPRKALERFTNRLRNKTAH